MAAKRSWPRIDLLWVNVLLWAAIGLAALTWWSELRWAAGELPRYCQGRVSSPVERQLYLRAMRLIRSGRDLDQARALLLRSSAIDPRSDVVYWMGKYYLAVGEPERALEQFSSYLEFDPTRVDAYLAASRILQERGRRQEARDWLERGSSYFESRREASEPRPDPGVAMRYNRKALEIHAYHDASIVRLEAELERIDGSGDGS